MKMIISQDVYVYRVMTLLKELRGFAHNHPLVDSLSLWQTYMPTIMLISHITKNGWEHYRKVNSSFCPQNRTSLLILMWRSYVTNHLYYLFCTMTGKRLPTHVGAKKSNKTQLVWAHGKLLAFWLHWWRKRPSSRTQGHAWTINLLAEDSWHCEEMMTISFFLLIRLSTLVRSI